VIEHSSNEDLLMNFKQSVWDKLVKEFFIFIAFINLIIVIVTLRGEILTSLVRTYT